MCVKETADRMRVLIGVGSGGRHFESSCACIVGLLIESIQIMRQRKSRMPSKVDTFSKP
jgi:hypothetical protein